MTVAANSYYVFRDEKVLARKERVTLLPFSGGQWSFLQPLAESILPIGKVPGGQGFAVEMASGFEIDNEFEWLSLRSLVGMLDDEMFNLWGRAAQLLHWQKNHRFCGRCGEKTQLHEWEQALKCPACSFSCYPRISPCIIVLVTRGEELLLARSPRFPEGMYSTLAGFVEVGEPVERTVQREIAEEVAIKVKNLRYVASQPWPFPDQLMLGFFAEYDSGEIQIDGQEICDAGWYHHCSLPTIPSEGTIAGRMIRQYIEQLNVCRA